MTLPFDSFETNNRLRFEALMTDSRVGLTFARLASEAAVGSEKRIRNQGNARKAYDAVLSLSRKSSLSAVESQGLAEGLTRLRSELEALGERFESDGQD
jgi:hypothetical protein